MRFSAHGGKAPPTAVLVHGILGRRQNMLSFARRLVEGFPQWQVRRRTGAPEAGGDGDGRVRGASSGGAGVPPRLSATLLLPASYTPSHTPPSLPPSPPPPPQVVVVDLRCHGESAPLSSALAGPHGLEAAAGDVIRLLSSLKLFPEMLIGHSFGGKVVMQMTQHWSGAGGRRVPRPVQVRGGAGGVAIRA